MNIYKGHVSINTTKYFLHTVHCTIYFNCLRCLTFLIELVENFLSAKHDTVVLSCDRFTECFNEAKNGYKALKTLKSCCGGKKRKIFSLKESNRIWRTKAAGFSLHTAGLSINSLLTAAFSIKAEISYCLGKKID